MNTSRPSAILSFGRAEDRATRGRDLSAETAAGSDSGAATPLPLLLTRRRPQRAKSQGARGTASPAPVPQFPSSVAHYFERPPVSFLLTRSAVPGRDRLRLWFVSHRRR